MGKIRKISLIPYLYATVGLLVVGVPMYLTIVNALKTTQEFFQNFFAPPTTLYLENFIQVIQRANYFLYVFNSAYITVLSLVGILIVSPLVAFPIARHMQSKRYYKFLYFFIIIGIFIPFQVKMLPIVILTSKLQLLNRTGLILLYICGALCQDVFLLVGYIQSLPRDMEEAAAIDGCSRIKTIVKIIFPLLQPMLATLLIKDALWIWNDFQLPLLILNSSMSSWTLPMFQYGFQNTYSVDYTMAFASFTLAIVPMMVLFVVAQKRIMGGLVGGAVKS